MYEPDDFAIETSFWGLLIFVAIFAVFLVSAVAVRRLLDRRLDANSTDEHSPPEIEIESWTDKAISRPHNDLNYAEFFGGDTSGFEGMTEREQEMFFSTYAPRKVRKAMKERQRAREQRRRPSS